MAPRCLRAFHLALLLLFISGCFSEDNSTTTESSHTSGTLPSTASSEPHSNTTKEASSTTVATQQTINLTTSAVLTETTHEAATSRPTVNSTYSTETTNGSRTTGVTHTSISLESSNTNHSTISTTTSSESTSNTTHQPTSNMTTISESSNRTSQPTSNTTTTISESSNTTHQPTSNTTTRTESTSNATSDSVTSPPTGRSTAAPTWIQKQCNVVVHITSQNFSPELNDTSSERFNNLSKQVTDALDQVYKCSTCAALRYVGATVIRFSPGSINADTLLSFATGSDATEESVNKTMEEALKTNNHSINGLTIQSYRVGNITILAATLAPTTQTPPITHSSGEPTSNGTSSSELTTATPASSANLSTVATSNATSPTSPHSPTKDNSTSATVGTAVSSSSSTHATSTVLTANTTSSPPSTSSSTKPPLISSSPSSTSGTATFRTQTPANKIYMTLRMANQIFSPELNDPSSQVYQDMARQVTQGLENVLRCASCVTKDSYSEATVLGFRQGSVIADTRLDFKGAGETPETVNSVMNQFLKDHGGFINGLQITDVTVGLNEPASPASGSVVPGWGIALLVLVCILVLLAIILIIFLLLRYCRCQKQREMDIFSTRGSYHPMNEYPTYQTHARYEAPGKKGSYEVQPNGANSNYSYTNPAADTNNL